MKKNLFYVFLFIANFLQSQDYAGNWTFTPFLNNGSTILKSMIDEDGNQTLLVSAIGNLSLNNLNVNLPFNTLILLRHNMKTPSGFKSLILSDQTVNPINFNVSDICKTKNGFGFCLNFTGQNHYLVLPLYPVKPTTPYNCAYLEFDSLLHFTGSTKFGSYDPCSINQLVADSNDNKCAFISNQSNVMINLVTCVPGSANKQSSLLCFKGDSIRWLKSFITLGYNPLTPSQLIAVKNIFYLLFISFEKNIVYDGKLLSRTGEQAYILLKINSSGDYLNEFETDSNTTSSVTCSVLASDTKVFLLLPYTTYLKSGTSIFSKPTSAVAQVIFELDTGLTVLNSIQFNALNVNSTAMKAYSKQDELLYIDVISNAAPPINRIPFGDSILFLSDWMNYPAYPVFNTLFSYSSRKKMLVSSYEISATQAPSGYFVYCTNVNVPIIYCQYYNRSNIKSDGQRFLNVVFNQYSFVLKKPNPPVSYPIGFKAKRTARNNTYLTWRNQEPMDSFEVQKFSTSTVLLEHTFFVTGNIDSFADLSLSLKSNYQYKIRGYHGGQYSIYASTDSTPTTDSLLLDRFLIGGIINNVNASLSWGIDHTPSGNIFFRELYRSENRDYGFIKIADISPRTLNNYIDTGLVPNRTYYYFVRDYNDMFDVHTDTVKINLGNIITVFSNTFNAFPNPCYNRIYYYLSDKSGKWVNVYDSKGIQTRLPIEEVNGAYYSDISFLANGIYTLTYVQYGNLYKKRIVKL